MKKDIKKGKITMVIIMSIVCFVLVMVMFMQFKIVNETDITSIENMRETELRTELANWKTKYEETNQKYEETRSKIEEYKQTKQSNEETGKVVDKELEQVNMSLGKADLEGQGVEIIIRETDNEEVSKITADDLIVIVNALRLSGAEAISINDQRIVSNTVIECIGTVIKINGQRVGAPFTIRAIGMPELLKNTYRNGGYLKVLEGDRIQVDFKTSDNITIPKYTGTYKFEYAQTINNK